LVQDPRDKVTRELPQRLPARLAERAQPFAQRALIRNLLGAEKGFERIEGRQLLHPAPEPELFE